MDNNQLEELLERLDISKDQILREEAEMIFLNELANNKLGTQIIG